MSLETGTYISDLVATNPAGTDPKSQGDDHLRLIKSALKNTFPLADGPIKIDPGVSITSSTDGLSGSLAVGANEAFQFKPVAGGLELSQDGITFQTVDTNGKVAFPAMGQLLGTNGYIKLPGGLIIQWGTTPAILSGVETGAPGFGAGSFPIPFPTALLHLSGTVVNAQATNQQVTCAVGIPTASQWSFGLSSSISATSLSVNWIAVGY